MSLQGEGNLSVRCEAHLDVLTLDFSQKLAIAADPAPASTTGSAIAKISSTICLQEWRGAVLVSCFEIPDFGREGCPRIPTFRDDVTAVIAEFHGSHNAIMPSEDDRAARDDVPGFD